MVEFAPTGHDQRYLRAFAGDSFNTAVYLARAGIPTRYLTRLGDDGGSEGALRFMREEGIDSGLIGRDSNRNIGLYLIDNDDTGERTFTYYRSSSPARSLFDKPLELQAHLFYFTGITLAVTASGHANLLRLLASLREHNCQIVFDPNYRAGLWDNLEQARDCVDAVLPFCNLVLPTQADDLALWDLATAAESTSFYRARGVGEVVVKGSELEVEVWSADGSARRKAEPVAAVDTTGAGDAFNAGYLASRLVGEDLATSLENGQRLAAEVVLHHGAIVPRAEAEGEQQ